MNNSRLFSSTARTFAAEVQAVDPKISKIVEDISKLNLLEASALVSALKVFFDR